ncbi:transposase [Streptomyces sp. NPDC006365]|uniref:transposase n=1 Tax=Streptomyces sp. NPDC006365 TaxID=3364744 RepID=UPI003686D79D
MTARRSRLGAAAPGREEARAAAGAHKRQLMDGIRWRTRAGAPWRYVPERYGPWETVYGLCQQLLADRGRHRSVRRVGRLVGRAG